jgi:hypothetical protein
MALPRIETRVTVDGRLISAAGAAVRPDGAVPRRPVEGARRRRPREDRHGDTEDTVTLHEPEAAGAEPEPDPVEALRRGGFRRPA